MSILNQNLAMDFSVDTPNLNIKFHLVGTKHFLDIVTFLSLKNRVSFPPHVFFFPKSLEFSNFRFSYKLDDIIYRYIKLQLSSLLRSEI